VARLSERESRQLEEANASGRQPVVFVHGLWLLPSSWDPWAELFQEAGYATVTAAWPGDHETVEEARSWPEAVAGRTVGQVVDHTVEVIGELDRKPAVVGHSFGGLFAQIVAGRGLSAASVAISPAQFRGILPVSVSTVRSVFPVLRNPLNRNRAISLTLDQFTYSWANALSDEQTRELYGRYHVPAAAMPIFQAATANLNPRTEVNADTRNPERGPLLLITGEADHTIAPSLVRAAFKKQSRNKGITEIEPMPDRGHSLTIDGGWRGVAERALAFVERFV